MKRVLVLDANQRSALATTRSLGQQHVPVFTADDSLSSLAGSSKFSQKYFTYPAPSTNSDSFIKFVARIVDEYDIQVLLPMTELTTALLLENQHKFNDAILPFSGLKNIDTLANKCSLMRIAESLDIPYPPTKFHSGDKNSSINFDEMNFPLVLKPGKSWLISQGKWIHTEVKFAHSAKEARSILEADPAFHNHPFMIQKCVLGHGEGIFALYDNERPITFFRHQRIREKPPWGGVSVLSQSTRLDPKLHHYAKLLLDKVGWHGIAMVEFKVDSNGEIYLMEINTRFWGSLQLSIDAGVDFPWMLYQIACGNKTEAKMSYSTNNRLRWLLGDFDSLYIYLKSDKYSFSQKIKRVFDFLMPSKYKTRHEVNRWYDMGPFKWELKQYLKDLK